MKVLKPRSKKTKQAKAPGAGRSGKPPPKEHQLKEGYDAKRDGKAGYRDTTRAIIQNCINGFTRRNVRDATLLGVMRDKAKPTYKKIAADYVLHSRRATTLLDLEPFLRGERTLKQLARAGVDVSVIKAIEYHKDKTIKRIELISAGENFDRIMNHTGISPSDQEKYRRIDQGKATEGVVTLPPAILERPIQPKNDTENP